MQDLITQSQQTEAALRQSEARFQRIAASVPGVIYQYLWHPDGSVAFPFVSPSCRELFEVEASEIEADASLLISMIHPEDVQDFNRSVAISIETLQPWSWKGRFLLASGQLKWVQVAAMPERQANGDILWDGLLMDITSRLQVEEALRQAREELNGISNAHGDTEAICASQQRFTSCTGTERSLGESEELLRRLVEQAADSIILHDLEGTILDVNQQACRSLGYTRQELLTLSVPDIEENYRPGTVWQYVIRGVPVTVNGRQRRKDGTSFPVEIRLSLLEFRGKRLILSLTRDITERKQVEEERDRTQRFLNSLLENLPVAVFVKDAEQLRFVFWNKMSTQLLGYSSQDVLGKSSYDLFPSEVADFYVAKDREVLESGKLLDIPEELVQTLHRGQRILHTTKIPILDEAGRPQYLLSITEDITERKQTEAALRQSQERLQTVMTAAPLILFALDREGIFTLSEGKGLELLGLKPGQLVGASIYERSWEQPEIIEYFNRVLAGEQLGNAVMNFAGIVFDNRYSIIRDEKGEVASITGVALDISDRQRAKEALQQSEQKFRSLVENANDIIYQLTPNGVFSYISPNWVDILGHDVSEVEGQVFTPFVHPDDLPICWNIFRQAITTGQNQSGVEYRVRHKDGTWRWHTSNLSVLKDASGNVLSVIGIARDISDRKHALEALRDSEERFRNLVESTNDLIWEVDENGAYTYVSPQVRDILGYEVEEVLGKTLLDFISSEEAYRITKAISSRVVKQLPFTNLENTNLHKNGHRVVLETSGVPFFDKAGNFKGYRGIDRDITKRKQIEEAIRQSKAQLKQQATQLKRTLQQLKDAQSQLIQTEKMSSLGQLVAGMAHEINNPVSFIYGNINHARRYSTELLQLIELYQEAYPQPNPELEAEIEEIDLDFVTEDFPRLLDSMETGAKRIREIVGSLRNFSRFDEAIVKQVDIHQGIDSTLMLLQSRFKLYKNSTEIQVIKEYGNLPLVECYPGHLNQVFMNLLSNAIDALDEVNSERNLIEAETNISTIRISTEINQESTSSPHVVIRIADNGTGMTEEVRLKAFDPFFTTKPVGTGTGLGLATSYQIVAELHKGQLQCNSALGQGTEFVIQIPIQQSFT
jgi:PAS domain S-box-containing protein